MILHRFKEEDLTRKTNRRHKNTRRGVGVYLCVGRVEMALPFVHLSYLSQEVVNTRSDYNLNKLAQELRGGRVLVPLCDAGVWMWISPCVSIRGTNLRRLRSVGMVDSSVSLTNLPG